MNGIEYELHVALLARLRQALGAQVTGVYADEVQAAATSPYVTIGNYTTLPYDSKTTDGREMTVTLHTWSTVASKAETLKLQSNIIKALKNPLTLREGHTVQLVRPELSETLRDTTDTTVWIHGVQRFRFKISEGVG
ncbi:TPA: DUF3168 domain-containing protein [Vibrio cholerae]